jgi:hypothetical protein
MAITFEQARHLSHGTVLHTENCTRWRVNGKPKTWKTMPDRIRIPVKHGLYSYDYVSEADLGRIHLEKDCQR